MRGDVPEVWYPVRKSFVHFYRKPFEITVQIGRLQVRLGGVNRFAAWWMTSIYNYHTLWDFYRG